jgi:hypothetical protein
MRYSEILRKEREELAKTAIAPEPVEVEKPISKKEFREMFGIKVQKRVLKNVVNHKKRYRGTYLQSLSERVDCMKNRKHVYLPSAIHLYVEDKAKEMGIAKADLIRRAIMNYIEWCEK